MSGSLAPAEIRALARILDEIDYYQLLEVEQEVPVSGVRQAYHQLQRRFHPDRNRDLDPETRGALETVAKRVSEAYAVLRDPRRRKAYDARRGEVEELRIPLVEAEAQSQRQSIEESLGKTPNGRRFFQIARSDIDKGDIVAALRNVKMALTFEPANEYFQLKRDELLEAEKEAYRAKRS